MNKVAFMCLVAALVSAPLAHAGPPSDVKLVYDGVLEQAGVPVTSSGIEFTFTLYDSLEAGTAICGPQTQTLPVAAGRFSAKIGELGGDVNCTDLANKLQQTAEVYLEIQVQGNTLAPRFKLESVPYATAAANGVPRGTIIYHQSGSLGGADWELVGGPTTIGSLSGTVYIYRKK